MTKPTYQELEKRLAVAEPIVEALKRHEVDAVVGEEKIAFLLLRGVGEALQNSDADINALFSLGGVGLVQADSPSFRFTRVNPAFCEMLGASAEELLAQTYIGLTHPLDRSRDMIELAKVLRGQTDSWVIQKRCVRADGGVVWVQVHGTVIRDVAGQAVRMMATIGLIAAPKSAGKQIKAPAKVQSPVRTKTSAQTGRKKRKQRD